MQKMQTLSIIIPALNEKKGIAQVLEALRTLSERLAKEPVPTRTEVIVVDDGSKDKTAEVASRFPAVLVIRKRKTRGYGAAIQIGFRAATGDLLAFLDADGTYPGEMFGELLKVLRQKQADLVIGSRFGLPKNRMPFRRKVGNVFFAHLVSWLTDQKIKDSASGMRILTRRALKFLQPLPNGLDFTPAMTVIALHERLRVIEYPIPYEERIGESKLSILRDGFRFLKTILNVARLYNPLKFFGMIGLSFLLLGLLLSWKPLMHYLFFREVAEDAIYRLFTIMVLWVTGVNLISFGAFSSHLLALLRGRENWQRSFWMRLFFRRGIIRQFIWIGASLMMLSVLINRNTVFEYITTLHIHARWTYLLTGAALFLIGTPLCMTGFLILTMEEVEKILRQRSLSERDNSPCRLDDLE